MADFTPDLQRANLQGYTGQGAFRFWCQMALPLVYDDSLSYYELLNKVVVYLNNTISDVATAETNIENINDTVEHNMDALLTAYEQLQGYVNDYFENLDVQEEINNKLDEMAASGALSNLLAPLIPDLVTSWLDTNVNPVGSAVVVDSSLSVSGAAADAKVTGERISENAINISDVSASISNKFNGNALSPFAINDNYYLRADGGGEEQQGYEIRRYSVSAGQILHIKSPSANNSPCKWVFKSSNSGVPTNNVGNLHHENGDFCVTVPAGATYLFLSTIAGNASTSVNFVASGNGYILYPCVFVYISAQKLHVECTTTARAILGNSILNVSGWSDIFSPRTNSTDALVMGTNAFSLKHVEDLTDADCVIALVYLPQKTVVAVDKFIYANAIPIDNLYKRSNVPVYINNRRIKQYQIAPNRNSANITDFGYFYKLNAVSSTQPLCYVAKNGKLVPNLNTYTTNNNSIANKTILCIGDSVTKRGWYQDRLKSHESTLSFIGTQTTYYGQNGNATGGRYCCEGYSGRTAKNVLVDSTILLNDNVTRITNPFYDSNVGKCDFGYYCRTQNVSPDYVLIEFGLNETDSNEYYTAVSSFIATIKAYNVNTVVYVVQPFNAIDGGDIGAANSMTAMQREACERCILESRSFKGCVLIPCWYIMVDAYDYPIADVSYGYGNVTIKQASDGVHPSESVGFAKLGDQLYNYLGVS